jgi:hypothetical protein
VNPSKTAPRKNQDKILIIVSLLAAFMKARGGVDDVSQPTTWPILNIKHGRLKGPFLVSRSAQAPKIEKQDTQSVMMQGSALALTVMHLCQRFLLYRGNSKLKYEARLNRLEFGHIKLNSQYQEPNY